jgi:excisionase family DNA binding protein
MARNSSRPQERIGMTGIAAAILDGLSETDLAELAERLRPYLTDRRDELLTPTQAADRLGIHPKTLTRAAVAGRVPGAVRVGRAWRFPADELQLNPPAGVRAAPVNVGRPQRATTSSTVDAIRGQL